MIIAAEFRGTATDPALKSFLGSATREKEETAIRVILDIEHLNWDFRLQAGNLTIVLFTLLFTDNTRRASARNHEHIW